MSVFPFDELITRSCSVFSKIALCPNEHNFSQIPESIIEAFARGDFTTVDESLSMVREIAVGMITKEDFAEAEVCLGQWRFQNMTRMQSQNQNIMGVRGNVGTPLNTPGMDKRGSIGVMNTPVSPTESTATLWGCLSQHSEVQLSWKPIGLTLYALMSIYNQESGEDATDQDDFNKNKRYSMLAFDAIHLYWSLLLLPASFAIQTPTLLRTSFSALQLFSKLNVECSLQSKKRESKKNADLEIDEIEQKNCEDSFTMSDMLSSTILSEIHNLLQICPSVVSCLSISNHCDLFEYIVDSLVCLTRIPASYSDSLYFRQILSSAFTSLTSLLKTDWNKVSVCFRSLLPNLLGVPLSWKIAGFNHVLPAKLATAIKNSAVDFLSDLLMQLCKYITEHPPLAETGSTMQTPGQYHGATPHLSASTLTMVRRRSIMGQKFNEEVKLAIEASHNTLLGWVYILLQHICTSCPDKSESRSIAVESVSGILNGCPVMFKNKLLALFLTFLKKFSETSRIPHRLMAVEVCRSLLNETSILVVTIPSDTICISVPGLAPLQNFGKQQKRKISNLNEDMDFEDEEVLEFQIEGKEELITLLSDITFETTITSWLLQILLRRSSDKGVNVRAKSLHYLADIITLASSADHDVHVPEQEQVLLAPLSTQLGEILRDGLSSVLALDGTSTSSLWSLIEMLLTRFCDSKAVVRRASIIALVGILECISTVNGKVVSNERVKKILDIIVGCLESSCSDISVVLRKESLNLLSKLLIIFPSNLKLQETWLRGVLTGVMDSESSMNEKSKSLLLESLLLPAVAPIAKRKAKSNVLSLADLEAICNQNDVCGACWSMLSAISDDSSLNSCFELAMDCIKSVPEVISAANIILNAMYSSLETICWTSNLTRGIWLIIDQLSRHIPSKLQATNIAGISLNVLRTDSINTYAEMDVKCRVIRSMGLMHSNLTESKVSSANKLDPELCGEFVMMLFDRINKLVDAPHNGVVSASVRSLFTLCTALEQAKLISVPQWEQVILSSLEEKFHQFVSASSHTEILKEEVCRSLFLLGELVLITSANISSSLLTLIVSMLPQTLGITDVNASSYSCTVKLDPSIRCQALLCVGKACLKNSSVAKNHVKYLVKELESDIPEMRNNAVLMLADVARIFTSLIEDHVDNMTLRLSDTNFLVRFHALTQLSQLLAEDFLKLKGSMFFRLSFCLADLDSRIRDLAEQMFREVIMIKMPAMISQHFVESLFYFNSFSGHPTFFRFPNSNHEKKFSLTTVDEETCGTIHENIALNVSPFITGNSNVSFRRHWIFAKLLSFMNDEQKFQITAKLSQEVLGGVVENLFVFDFTSSSLIKDALLLLASPHIKLSISRSSADEESPEDEISKISSAKSKVLSQMVKKNFLENVIPLLIELKSIFEKSHSSLLRYLMAYLREFLGEYKKDLESIIGDSQLAKELKFDFDQWEMKQSSSSSTVPKVNKPMNTTKVNTLVPETPTHLPKRSKNSLLAATTSEKAAVGFMSPRLHNNKRSNVSSMQKPSVLLSSLHEEINVSEKSKKRADVEMFSPEKTLPVTPWKVSVKASSSEMDQDLPVEDKLDENTKIEFAVPKPKKSTNSKKASTTTSLSKSSSSLFDLPSPTNETKTRSSKINR